MQERTPYGRLQLDEDMRLQRVTWTVERIGWVLMGLVLLADLLGLLGAGPRGWAHAGDQAQGLRVEYRPRERLNNPTSLNVQLVPQPPGQERVQFWVSRELLDNITLERVEPEPESVLAAENGMELVFHLADSQAAANVRLSLRYLTWGRVRGALGVPGLPAVELSQLVLP
jgi:hypothetical protein